MPVKLSTACLFRILFILSHVLLVVSETRQQQNTSERPPALSPQSNKVAAVWVCVWELKVD